MTDTLVSTVSLWACLAVMPLAILHIVRVDLVQLEISFGGCAILVVSGLAAATIIEGMPAILDGLIAGALAAAVAAIVHVLMPARLGRGDIVLLGAMATVTGTALMVLLMALFLVSCVLTSAIYSVRRGKRLFRSAFPAALPGMAALAPVLVLRHLAPFPPGSVAVETTWFIFLIAAIAGLATFATIRARRTVVSESANCREGSR